MAAVPVDGSSEGVSGARFVISELPSERQVDIASLSGFNVLEEIGSGTTAKVHLCQEKSTSQRFALKVFRKGTLKRQKDWSAKRSGGTMKCRTALDKVYDEVRILRRIEHPSCIRLHAIHEEADSFGKLFLVLEYAAGGASMQWKDEASCFSVATGGVFQELRAKALTLDVLSGLSYLHRSRIAHRDIKPQNVMIMEDGGGKITDFGVACDTDEAGYVFGTEGTYAFYSPEMCNTSESYSGHDGRRADVWALGVTLWAFVHGTVPFYAADPVCLFEAIASARLRFPSGGSSALCRATLVKLLAAKPSDRPLLWELEDDTWLYTAFE